MKRYCALAALLVAFAVGWAKIAVTQDAPKSTPASRTNNPQTATEIAAAVAAQDPEKELRYQFVSHAFAVNGTEQEIFLKLDTYTGKTWRFHASSGKWQPIAEPAGGYPRPEETFSRYELMSHDYFDTYGEEQELIMRVDMVAGNSWTYRGANGIWKDIPTEN
jgi:hypothetical protein